jgi:hypothetical protein
MSKKISLSLNLEMFSDFVDKLQDLTNISDTIKLKIDKEYIMAYSMLSNDVAVLCLKNYSLKTSSYIDNFDTDEVFDYIITGAPKFVKNLKFFNSDSSIKMDIDYKPSHENHDVMHIRAARFSNGKLKISCVGGELSKIRDISKSKIESLLNIKNSKWGFKISKSDFSDIKKLSSINSEDKILTVISDKGIVSVMEEYKWELEVDKIKDEKYTKIIFNKKYLSNINAEREHIDFNIFETFILVRDENSNLMLSFETDFSTED